MEITPSLLRECLRYDPETGMLWWRARPVNHFITQGHQKAWNTQHANRQAFLKTRDGYHVSSIQGKHLLAHRVAWMIACGDIPEKHEIDHINGVRTDNRLTNLRVVSRVENQRNRGIQRNNKSGVPGVAFAWGKWTATIKCDGKSRWLGCFNTKEEAVAARKDAERAAGYHPNYGRAA